MGVVDYRGRVLTLNEAGLRLHGFNSLEEMFPRIEQYRECFELRRLDGGRMPPEDWPIARVLRGEAVAGMEVLLRRLPDGEARIVAYSATPIPASDGRPGAIVFVMRDITDERRIEAELRDSEERYRAIVESQAEMICRFRPEGEILFANAAYARAWGATRESLIGANLWGLIDPQDHPHVLAQLERLSPSEPEVRIENRIETDRGVRWTMWTNCAMRFDAAGRPVEVQSAGIDITDRKLAEQALRQSEERLRLAQQVAGVGTFEWNVQTGVNQWSPELEALYGIESGAFEGTYKAWRRRVHPDDIHEAERRIGDALRTGVFEGEWRVIWPDGSVRWLAGRGQMFHDEAGRPLRMVGVNLDITQRKLAEQALERSRDELELHVAARTAELQHRADQLSRLSSQLTMAEQVERRRLAQLLHDHLQQLLVAARVRLDIAAHGCDPRLADRLEQVQALIDDAMDASRSLTVELSPPILHDAGLAAALPWLGRWMLEKHGLEVELAVDPAIAADREDVRVLVFGAVRELLFNVVKHAGVNRARVALAAHDESNLRVVVEDRGRGFDPAAVADAGSGGDGHAFGLFSIRERLSLLGGRFVIESGPGDGSRFTLVAPRSHARPAAPTLLAPPAAEGQGWSASRGRLRVLLVDDHDIFRQGLAALIGAEPDLELVGEACDGLEAVERARDLAPDLIVMDFSMPRMDGAEATRRIREQIPSARVVGLSMYSETDRAAAMIDAGAAVYLTKSDPSAALLAAIRAVGRPIPTAAG